LNTSVEKLEGTRVRLTVTLTTEDVDKAVGAAYVAIASRVRIPGFRAGKAPRPIIDTHVGRETVLAQALEDLVDDGFQRALEAENLRPIERPDVGTLDGLEPGEEYTFSAEFDTRPQLTLTSTKDLTVSVPPSKSSDREVDAQMDYLRDRFASVEPVEDRGVAADDFALISFVGTIDGEAYEGNTVDQYLYELGRGGMPKEFDAALIGAKAGETVTAAFDIPDTSSNPEFVGRPASFEIVVHEVKAKVLPEVDDDFAANVGGFETADELREDIRTKLDQNKAAGHVRLIERQARTELAKRLEGDIPEAMVQSMAAGMTDDFFETLQKRGYSIEQYVESTGASIEQIQEDIAGEARDRVRDELALEALFGAEGMDMTEGDIAEELSSIAESEKISVEAAAQRLRDSGLMPLVKERVIHRKAVRWLMDNVEVVEEEPAAEVAGGTAKVAKAPKKGTSKKKAAAKDAVAADEEA
jgi:trigger factor